MDDPYNLRRFVEAQQPVYAQVCAELRSGQKRSHWMWFIFPQIKGLGNSPMATKFAISSRTEAQAFLDHPLLGPRLRECTRLVLQSKANPIGQILGYPDDVKFRSSMTLFASVAADAEHGAEDFVDALTTFYGGEFDALTLERL
jgi:uncharacterized protein (DUF1810 family)